MIDLLQNLKHVLEVENPFVTQHHYLDLIDIPSRRQRSNFFPALICLFTPNSTAAFQQAKCSKTGPLSCSPFSERVQIKLKCTFIQIHNLCQCFESALEQYSKWIVHYTAAQEVTRKIHCSHIHSSEKMAAIVNFSIISDD